MTLEVGVQLCSSCRAFIVTEVEQILNLALHTCHCSLSTQFVCSKRIAVTLSWPRPALLLKRAAASSKMHRVFREHYYSWNSRRSTQRSTYLSHRQCFLPASSTPRDGRSRTLADVTPSTLSTSNDCQLMPGSAARKVRGADSVFRQDSQ